MSKTVTKDVGAHCVLYTLVKNTTGRMQMGFLLQRRTDDCRIYPGYWSLVGGGMDNDETPEQALVREIEEEIGVNHLVIEPEFLDLAVDIYRPNLRVHYFSAKITEPIHHLKLSDECSGIAYFSLGELPTIHICPEHLRALQTFIERNN